MSRFLILYLAIAAVNGAPHLAHLDDRIVGGEPTTIEEYPYQASLQYFGSHICGGSIISHDFVITAAHCTTGTYSMFLTVRLGSSLRQEGGEVIRVKEVYQNPLFSIDTMDYDISILRLAQNVNFGPSVLPIGLASNNYKIDPNTNFIVTGWGTLSSNGSSPSQLQVVKIPYVNSEKCQKAYNLTITKRMICAAAALGGKDSCQGDSGGPLVADGVLVGIVSWGLGCAEAQFPGVYSRISELRDYIKNITNI